MVKLSEKLSSNLTNALKNADEIWIAVALLNLDGIEFISKVIRKDCRINFIGGIDLPTDPAALTKLLSLKAYKTVSAYIFTKEVYHPKVYIVKKGNRFKSFIGSANCTRGGLDTNVEMTIEIDNQVMSKVLLEWFTKIQQDAQILTTDFISEYLPVYKQRMRRRRNDQIRIRGFKKKAQGKIESNLKEKRMLVDKLKKIRASREYPIFKRERHQKIKELKKALDYPNFVKLDLSAFWRIKHLGTIVPIRVKSKIDNDRPKFARLMKFICDDSLPLSTRIDEALKGKLSIKNVSEAFISKVLVIHNPHEYYVHNTEFSKSLKPFGLSFTRGLSVGEKYQLTRDTLKIILQETKIDDFSVLDQCLIIL